MDLDVTKYKTKQYVVYEVDYSVEDKYIHIIYLAVSYYVNITV